MHRAQRNLTGVAVLVVLALLGPPAAATSSVSEDSTSAGHVGTSRGRAIQTYAAMQSLFYRPSVRLYRETYPGRPDGNPYSYHWPFSQALVATVDMAMLVSPRYRADVAERVAGTERYWDPNADPPGYDSYVRPPLGHGGEKFYDDNEWTGLGLTQAYGLTGRPQVLRRARQTFAFAVSGWDTDPSHPAPGGVFWVQAPWNRDRTTVSNAPAVELGLLLYGLSTDKQAKLYYLRWAQRMYRWVYANMLAPNDLFWDSINLQGSIDKTQWSYNQGTMIGANVLFYKVTGRAEYLHRAERIARAARARFTVPVLDTEPAAFNAIYFRNVALLAAVQHDPTLLAPLHAWAEQVWRNRRDPRTGTFSFSSPASLLDQAAMVQIYAIASAASLSQAGPAVRGPDD